MKIIENISDRIGSSLGVPREAKEQDKQYLNRLFAHCENQGHNYTLNGYDKIMWCLNCNRMWDMFFPFDMPPKETKEMHRIIAIAAGSHYFKTKKEKYFNYMTHLYTVGVKHKETKTIQEAFYLLRIQTKFRSHLSTVIDNTKKQLENIDVEAFLANDFEEGVLR